MAWRFFRGRDLRTTAERMRDQHSAWLTVAVMTGKVYPRIPTRRVAQGGFDAMRMRPGGAARAEAWWRGALGRVDDA